jgi:hypothetical protein
VLLAWLPPGPPGGHAPRDLPATWAASHLLGLFALVAERALLPGASALVLLAPWLVLAGVRLATLPAGLVPRHPPAREPASRAVRLLRAAAFPCALGVLMLGTHPAPRPIDLFAGAAERVLGPDAPLVACGWLALWILVDHALASARRAPLGRACLLLVLVATPAPLRYAAPAALALGTGTAFLVPCVRLGDRRAAGLSATGFAALALFGRPTLALVGLAVLVLVATRPRRRLALAAALGAGIPAALASRLHQVAPGRPDSILAALREAAEQATQSGWGVVWWALPPSLVLAVLAFGAPGRAAARVDDVERELRALVILFFLLLVALVPTFDAEGVSRGLVELFPLAALLGGLVWVRSERVPDSASG